MLKRLKSSVKASAQQFLQRRGYTAVPLPLKLYLQQYRIDLVFDCGAASGSYGHELRASGFTGKIVSYEPLPESFGVLRKAIGSDANWLAVPKAVGRETGEFTLHIASNGDSSSLSPMNSKTTEVSPDIYVKSTVQVQVTTLATEIATHCPTNTRLMVKLDIQGHELNALRGAGESLKRVVLIQAELSLQPLYEGCPMIEEVVAELRGKGFTPIWFHHGYKDSAKQELLQVDGFFLNTALYQPA
jgi:FkbM family methyltransferase